MTSSFRKPAVTTLALAISVALGLTAAPVQAYESPVHVFSVNDVLGDFEGSTYGDSGATADKTILCGMADSFLTTCPEDAVQPIVDKKTGLTLYPVDSEFGFYVVDFVGAQEKIQDGDYGEGYAGNLPDGSGVAVANQETDRYKVKPPLGTWCQGLGGNSVKCDTEHYTVMEHVLSCHEVIPYFFANPETGLHEILETPDGTLSVDCGLTPLDDDLKILVGGSPTTRLTSAVPGDQMNPNDNTSVLDDIAASTDYSVTLKDDGKALYRWGALVKRPNDMRLYARLQLPEEWKERDANGDLANDFPVTKAWLVVNHTITNNPNDQIRPEDLENEAAIGVLPDHQIEGLTTADPSDDRYKSTKPCYEGDGDLIDNEFGNFDPAALDIGTVFKNEPFAIDPTATPGVLPADDPYAFSEDLTEGLTNAWYTTIDREPFEWSYVIVTDDFGTGIRTVDYRGCPGPVEDPAYAELCTNVPDGTPLFSGPRWRLKPAKFGQDLPGLEVPTTAGLEEPCTPPPFSKELIKYEVGVPTTTIINLLDWDDEEGPSPLATSKGWVDTNFNAQRPVVDEVVDDNGEVRQITDIGGPMSEDLDVMIYVKGDRKPVFLYNAQLILEYEGGTEPPADAEADMELNQLITPLKVSGQTPGSRVKDLLVTACNVDADGEATAASGTITLYGDYLQAGIPDENFTAVFDSLLPGACETATFEWTAPDEGTSVDWTATVTVTGDVVDPNPDNNTAEDTTLVYPFRK